MEWLFLRSSEAWAGASADDDRWRGLALYGVDGSTLRVADSAENRAHFGGPRLVRIEMKRIATELGVVPTRITMRDRLRRFLLPPRRPERVFPRAVKIEMSNYLRKVPAKSSSRSRAN